MFDIIYDEDYSPEYGASFSSESEFSRYKKECCRHMVEVIRSYSDKYYSTEQATKFLNCCNTFNKLALDIGVGIEIIPEEEQFTVVLKKGFISLSDNALNTFRLITRECESVDIVCDCGVCNINLVFSI